jgi:trehalose/maltose hydrolase-like predicted phosphorylase
MTTDETSNQVNNNSIYTNTLASLSIFLEKYTSCLINQNDEILTKKNAQNKARCIHIPFDQIKDINLEYERFSDSQFIAQSDVVFTNYPLMMLNSKENNLNYYQNLIKNDDSSIIGLTYYNFICSNTNIFSKYFLFMINNNIDH